MQKVKEKKVTAAEELIRKNLVIKGLDRKRKTIVFDVDGTLITTDKSPHPRNDVIALLKAFYHLGWNVVVHSGGGTAYASNWIRRLGLDEDMFITVAMKGDKKIHYDIAVDDCLEEGLWTKEKSGNYIDADYYINV